jgi:septum formation protein
MVGLGVPFTVVPPGIDEKAVRAGSAEELVRALGLAKAEAVIRELDAPAVVITSDQVVEWRGQILEKPADADEARRWLIGYADEPPLVVTSVVVTDVVRGRDGLSVVNQLIGVDSVFVRFRSMTPRVIESAIKDGPVMLNSGAIAVEHWSLAPYVEQLEGAGSDNENLDSLLGLPTRLLLWFLTKFRVGVD